VAYSDIKIEDLQLFVSIVELSSITGVADRFETTSSTISRRLKNMEESLGVRLIERTTRSQQVTPAGEHFYQHCQTMLNQIEDFSNQINDQRDLPEGHISVYAPSELFSFLINELTTKFTQRYPKLRVEFISGAVKPRLVEDNIDVLIHVDEPQDSSFVARKITTSATNYFASQDYIDRRGRPSYPRDIENHDCIAEINHERVARPWQILEGDTITTLRIKYLYSSDSITLCQALAEQGQGITMLPDFITRESVSNGKLVQLFSEDYTITHNIYAIYASRHFVPARIRTFVDFLSENLPGKI
jgi:DNA-binding transcriptional LysR family regulator